MDQLLTILFAALIILAIIVIAAIAYIVILGALFTPIGKLLKYDEQKLESEREYNELDAKKERLKEETELSRDELNRNIIKNNEMEEDLRRKQKLYLKYNDEFKEFRKWQAVGHPKATHIKNYQEFELWLAEIEAKQVAAEAEKKSLEDDPFKVEITQSDETSDNKSDEVSESDKLVQKDDVKQPKKQRKKV